MGMAQTWGFALAGIEARSVRVEAHVRPGLPSVSVVGLPGTAVREARERIRSAAASSGVPLPTQRITVNLSPADLRKDGPGLDLPVALAMLAAAGYLPAGSLDRVAAVGEVALDGGVLPVRGTLPVAESAVREGHRLLVLPVAGLAEASLVPGMVLAGVRSLREGLAALADPSALDWLVRRGSRWLARNKGRHAEQQGPVQDFAEVSGQGYAKRALEIAAAGRHHVLLQGSPGAGKTMLARRMPSIMPAMTEGEALEVTRVWSASGLRSAEFGVARGRPFRAPHHSASRSAILGGGPIPRPGEISLAHRGVLFLDELPEFARDVLEGLRQPLEDGEIAIARRDSSWRFPARFLLVGAMNPCPCGYFGHPRRTCRCGEGRIASYLAKASGPLLDRIDLQIEVALPRFSSTPKEEESSEVIRRRVEAACRYRRLREAGLRARGRLPSLHPAALGEWADLDPSAERLLKKASADGLGGRGYVRTLRVARTIADLDGSARVREGHVSEALGFRVGVGVSW